MVLAQSLRLGQGVIDWFISTVPKPFKIIIFLFLLAVAGATINGLFVVNYECDLDAYNNSQLVDVTIFTDSGQEYIQAYLYKSNISLDSFNLTDQTAEYNDTVKEFIKWSELSKITLGVTTTFERFYYATKNFLFNINDFSSFSFVTRFQSPETYYCTDLYASLPESVNKELGLTSNCTIDDIPTPQLFRDKTRINSSGEINQLFVLNCFDKKPRLTILGFDFLNWKLWVVLIVFGTAFTFGLKWREHLRNH